MHLSRTHSFRIIAGYLSTVVNFNLAHLHLVPPFGIFEFCRDLWHQKTKVPGLSSGVVCVILGAAD